MLLLLLLFNVAVFFFFFAQLFSMYYARLSNSTHEGEKKRRERGGGVSSRTENAKSHMTLLPRRDATSERTSTSRRCSCYVAPLIRIVIIIMYAMFAFVIYGFCCHFFFSPALFFFTRVPFFFYFLIALLFFFLFHWCRCYSCQTKSIQFSLAHTQTRCTSRTHLFTDSRGKKSKRNTS